MKSVISVITTKLFVLFFLLGASSVHAQEHVLIERVKTTIERLQSFSEQEITELPSETRQQIVEFYADAVNLTRELSHSGLSREEKILFLVDLAKASGSLLTEVAAPFENNLTPPQNWTAKLPFAEKVLYLITGVFRDLARAVGFSVNQNKFIGLSLIPGPFSSNDEKRAEILEKIGKLWEKAVTEEIKDHQKKLSLTSQASLSDPANLANPAENIQALAGVQFLVDQTQGSEVIREGRFNQWVYRLMKWAVTPFMFLNPPLILSEMNTYAPLTWGVIWGMVALYLSHVRHVDSGVDLYESYSSILKKLIKIQSDSFFQNCLKELQGRGQS